MSKRLAKARKKTKELPDSFFGEGTALKLSDLPCLKDRPEKTKRTFNYKVKALEKVEKMAKENNVSVGDLISDILDKVL